MALMSYPIRPSTGVLQPNPAWVFDIVPDQGFPEFSGSALSTREPPPEDPFNYSLVPPPIHLSDDAELHDPPFESWVTIQFDPNGVEQTGIAVVDFAAHDVYGPRKVNIQLRGRSYGDAPSYVRVSLYDRTGESADPQPDILVPVLLCSAVFNFTRQPDGLTVFDFVGDLDPMRNITRSVTLPADAAAALGEAFRAGHVSAILTPVDPSTLDPPVDVDPVTRDIPCSYVAINGNPANQPGLTVPNPYVLMRSAATGGTMPGDGGVDPLDEWVTGQEVPNTGTLLNVQFPTTVISGVITSVDLVVEGQQLDMGPNLPPQSYFSFTWQGNEIYAPPVAFPPFFVRQVYPFDEVMPAVQNAEVINAGFSILGHYTYLALRVTYLPRVRTRIDELAIGYGGRRPFVRLFPRDDKYMGNPRMHPMPSSQQTKGRITGYQ